MNALNGAQSDTYIFQILIQQELQKLVKILQKDHFKDIKFLVKTRDIQKIEKKNNNNNNYIVISYENIIIGYENKEKNPIYVSKKMLRRETC